MNPPFSTDEKRAIVRQNERSLRKLAVIIEASQGEFELILARCNYVQLQNELVQELRRRLPFQSGELGFQETDSIIYDKICDFFSETNVGVVHVLDLELKQSLDKALLKLNQDRDKFRNNLLCPLVIWLTDEGYQILLKQAPDFENWSTSVYFTMPTDILLNSLRQEAEQLFMDTLTASGYRVVDNSAFKLKAGSLRRQELEAALQDLDTAAVELDGEISASLQFLLGRDEAERYKFDEAEECFKNSLDYWQRHQNFERQGCSLFHLGLCLRWQAMLKPARETEYYEEACNYFQRVIESFTEANRSDLRLAFIPALADTLYKLNRWKELEVICNNALELQKDPPDRINLAFIHGKLASVYLEAKNWQDGRASAEKALENLRLSAEGQSPQPNYTTDGWVHEYHVSLYYWLLGRALKQLGEADAAIRILEDLRSLKKHQYDPQLYINILNDLNEFYFAREQYSRAYEVKQERRSIQQQYGIRAFVGAGWLQPKQQITLETSSKNTAASTGSVATEIAASGRQEDIKNLIKRLDGDEDKLIVLHGFSGVGKSSLLYAGLLPCLKGRSFETKTYLVIAQRSYSNWALELKQNLSDELELQGCLNHHLRELPADSPVGTDEIIAALLEQLKQNAEYKGGLRTVLIFDQFEEFFSEKSINDVPNRLLFSQFIDKCLGLPDVKVILSLREDYLHLLLEFDQSIKKTNPNYKYQMSNTLDNILKKELRCPVKNLSCEDTKNLIQELTQCAGSPFSPELIERVVSDLAEELGEVRPIELQIVGTRLQDEKITTLEQYEALGEKPRIVLVRKFLEEVIKDCGHPNENVTKAVLSSLTDEKGTRPSKTKAELQKYLSTILVKLAAPNKQLDLILDILVKSGLVLLLKEIPTERYQLVHDYLATLIANEIREQYEQVKRKVALAEENERRATENSRRWRIGVLFLVSVAGCLAFLMLSAKKVEIQARNAESLAKMGSGNELDALLTSVEAGKKLKSLELFVPLELQIQTIGNLQQVINDIMEKNRWQATEGSLINGIGFNQNGLVSVDSNGLTRIWGQGGCQIKSQKLGRGSSVIAFSLSRDGQMVATVDSSPTNGSKTYSDIHLWRWNGGSWEPMNKPLKLEGSVSSLSFSPKDSQSLISASENGKVELWRLSPRGVNDRPSITIINSKTNQSGSKTNQRNPVSFSPDGQKFALIGSDGNSIELWDLQGRKLKTFKSPSLDGNQGQIWELQFSPDGEHLISGSTKGTIDAWSTTTGQHLLTKQGDTDTIKSLSFSKDGAILASASKSAVKLWSWSTEEQKANPSVSLQELAKLKSAEFVEFSPTQDGILATADNNGTIRLWQTQRLKGDRLQMKGESSLTTASFSRDGRTLATVENPENPENSQVIIRVDDQKQTSISIKELILQGRKSSVRESFPTISQIRLSSDSRLLAVVANQRDFFSGNLKTVSYLTVWNVRNRTKLPSIPSWSEASDITALSFSPDNSLLAIAERTKLTLWEIQNSKPHVLDLNSVPQNLEFSLDGQLLAVTGDNGDNNVVQIYQRKQTGWEKVNEFASKPKITSLRFSPDNRKIVIGNENSSINIWKLNPCPSQGNFTRPSSGSCKPEMLSTPTEVEIGGTPHINFAQDGKIIVSAQANGVIKIWNSEDGKLLTTLKKGSTQSIAALGISDETKQIYTIDVDGQRNTWNLDLEILLKKATEWLRNYSDRSSGSACR